MYNILQGYPMYFEAELLNYEPVTDKIWLVYSTFSETCRWKPAEFITTEMSLDDIL